MIYASNAHEYTVIAADKGWMGSWHHFHVGRYALSNYLCIETQTSKAIVLNATI